MATARPHRRHRFAVAAALLGVLAPLALFAAPAATAGPAGSGRAAPLAAGAKPSTLDVAILQSIGSLNPFLGYFASDAEVFRLIYPTLTMYSQKDFSTVPGLATSWKVSSDNLTWTFTIRDGATWSDGKPITAHDAEFTYNLMLTNADARTANGSVVANFAGVTAPDDHTLVIRTRTPSASMLVDTTIPIVPQHLWKDVKDVGTFKNDTFPVVGSGPFVLTGFSTDQFIKLEAAKGFWGDRPKFDRLTFRYYKNSDAAIQALIHGEVDIVGAGDITPAQYNALKGHKDITPSKGVGRRFTEITFNPGAATGKGEPIGDGNAALKDVKVRQAIAMAIDRKTLVAKTQGGYAQLGSGYVPPIFANWHWEPDAQSAMDYDPDAANKLLDDAGYKRGGDGIRTAPDGGKPLKFRFYGHEEKPTEALEADFIKGWLKKIGIAVDVQMLNGTRLNDLVNTGKFDITFSGWGVDPDPDFILSLNVCANRPNADGKGGSTDTFFCDKHYDELYAQQTAQLDATRRRAIVGEMQQILYTKAPVVTLFYQNILEAYRNDRVTGIVRQPDGDGIILRQAGYWGYVSATPVASPSSKGGSGNTVLIVVVVVAAVVLLLGGGFALRRRRTADERE